MKCLQRRQVPFNTDFDRTKSTVDCVRGKSVAVLAERQRHLNDRHTNQTQSANQLQAFRVT